jgi:hypothetical protein
MPTTFHNHSIAALVDELGDVKAAMADLKTREDAIKAELLVRKISEAEGDLFRATISSTGRRTV